MRIAIFGATSQIAKDLVVSFSKYENHELILFSRNTLALDKWLENTKLNRQYLSKSYEQIEDHIPFDALINFVGVGDPAKAMEMGASIFEVTYRYDDIALNYVRQNPDCRYLFISSGAVYGSNFAKPVDENTEAKIPINNLHFSNWYGVAKLAAESRHRAYQAYSIIDIRIFNYFSHTQNMSSRFFITDAVRAITSGTVLSTSNENIIRDYLHPIDFYQMISCLLNIQNKNTNLAIDCYSQNPLDKMTLLAVLQNKYNLKYQFDHQINYIISTGTKLHYYSLNRKASQYKYAPQYSSLDGLLAELELLFN